MNILYYLGRGIAHEYGGIPCQDAVGYRYAPNGNAIAVLSDGAGNARYAAEAACETVDAVLDYFTRVSLDEYVGMDSAVRPDVVLDACRTRLLSKQAELMVPDLRHLSATLIFFVVSRTHILLGHLGDGTVITLAGDGSLLLHSLPEQNPASPNSTYFVVSPRAQAHLRLYLYNRAEYPADFIILTSDGPYDMLCSRGDNDPVVTARELHRYVREWSLNSDESLADVLNQMAEFAVEQLDDWSVLVWNGSAPPTCPAGETAVRSMLQAQASKHRTAHVERTED